LAHCTYRYILEYIEEYIYFHLEPKTKVERAGLARETREKPSRGKLLKVKNLRDQSTKEKPIK